VPDSSFINLLPANLKRNTPAGANPQQPAVPVPPSAVPRFGAPALLVPDNFWSNLKQFLTERPIKVVERPDAPFTRNSFGGGVSDNLKEFFSSRPAPKGPLNSRLAVNWGSSFGGFFYRIKEALAPTKLPPLQVTSKPVKVKEIWSKDENFGFNADSGEYVDLVKAGVIDPAKVTRLALQNAASIAGLMLTTEALVAELKEDDKKGAAAGGPGGPGGMGGMY